MNAYYPPMTGLETHMEDEIKKEVRQAAIADQPRLEGWRQTKPTPPPPETEMDHKIELAMVLGQ